jgi:hypothetical protein
MSSCNVVSTLERRSNNAMDDPAEYEKRYQAIQLYEEGTEFTEVLWIVQRARSWLCKWLR